MKKEFEDLVEEISGKLKNEFFIMLHKNIGNKESFPEVYSLSVSILLTVFANTLIQMSEQDPVYKLKTELLCNEMFTLITKEMFVGYISKKEKGN